jgi:hypothetical protein
MPHAEHFVMTVETHGAAMPIELPNLPYSHDALEPHISSGTLQ